MKTNDDVIEVTAALEKISGQVQDALDGPIDELKAQMLECQQKLARRGGDADPGEQAPGKLAQFVANDPGFKMLVAGHTKNTSVRLTPAAIHTKAGPLTSIAGFAADHQTTITVPAMRRLSVRDLLSVLRTDAGSIEYLRETAFVNGAAIVAEGALKPESTPTLSMETAPVITIATWASASKQILADNAQLSLYLDTRLRHAVRDAEEVQLLMGSGVGLNMAGLYIGGTAFVAPFTFPTPTKIDTIRLAIAQLEDAAYSPTGIVLHPNDWAAIELLKLTDGAYIKSNPESANTRTLWGVPVVATTAMTAGNFLVGDFQSAAILYDREDPILDIGTVDDDFIRNIVRLRLEERVSLALQLPGALIKGVFA